MDSKCDICLGREEVQTITSEMPVLLLRHLGVETIGDLSICGACNRLLELWDTFSERARMNLKSNPFIKKIRKEPFTSLDKDNPVTNSSVSTYGKRKTRSFLTNNNIDHNFQARCHICEDTFTSQESLEDHIKGRHINQKFQLVTFIRIIPELVSLQAKKPKLDSDVLEDEAVAVPLVENTDAVNSGETIVTCTVCDKDFPSKPALLNHLMVHVHKVHSKYKCALCVFKSLYSSNLKSHMKRIHLKLNKNVKCKMCDAVFCTTGALDAHILLRHNNSLPFTGVASPDTFESKKQLHGPMKTMHVGTESKVKCKYCLKWFGSAKSLSAHVCKIHPQLDTIPKKNQYEAWDPNFNKDSCTCPYCFRSFVKSLEVHIINCHPYPHLERKQPKYLESKPKESEPEIKETHSPSEPKLKQVSIVNYLGPTVSKLEFSCEFCNNEFETKTGMMRHIAKAHLKLFARTCDICQKVFTTPKGMKVHRNAHKLNDVIVNSPSLQSSSETFCCNFCKVTVPTELEFITHLQSHAKEKKFNVKLKSNPDGNVSEIVDNSRTVEQVTDSESLQNVTENVIKNTSSLFPCAMCNKAFTTRFSLNMHSKKYHTSTSPSPAVNTSFDEIPKTPVVNKVEGFVCDECGKNLPTRRGLIHHKKTHLRPVATTSQASHPIHNTDKGKFDCKFCGKRLSIENDFIEHIKAHALGNI